jgi:hypothetical protein
LLASALERIARCEEQMWKAALQLFALDIVIAERAPRPVRRS